MSDPVGVPLPKRRRLTRRGHYLLAFGIVQLGLGLGGLATTGRSAAAHAAAELLPPVVYAVLSVVVALLAIAAAFARPTLERAAFSGLAALAALRGLTYLAAGLLEGIPTLLTAALVFGLVLRVHLLVAGWPDPQPPVAFTQAQLAALADELTRRADDKEG